MNTSDAKTKIARLLTSYLELLDRLRTRQLSTSEVEKARENLDHEMRVLTDQFPARAR